MPRFLDGHDDEAMTDPQVLYLDQKDWIHLDLAIRGKARQPEEETAAKTLLKLVEAGQVVVPLSAGHVDELDKQSGTRRRLLGETMLRLSGSWKMISPLVVRQAELDSAMREIALPGLDVKPIEVFTTEPGPHYLGDYEPYQPSNEFPEAIRQAIAGATGDDVHRSLLLEKSRTPGQDAEAYAAKERWAAGTQRLADFLKENRRTGQKLEMLAAGVMLADLQNELALAAVRAGLTPSAFADLKVEGLIAAFDAKPFLRLLFGLYERRLRNPSDPWKPNDLNDMHFLGLAAAYADLLVAEKHFHKLLMDIRGRARIRASLFTRLPDCLDVLPPTS